MATFVIADWQSKFETAETRKLEHLKWSPAPNKLDGLGYRIMVQERDRSDLFAAWNIIRAVASKTSPKERRGRLERDGRPLTAMHLAVMSGFPPSVFERALSFFSSDDIGWLVKEEAQTDSATAAAPESNPGESPARPADVPATPASVPAVWKVEKGTEQKERNVAQPALRWTAEAGWSGVTDEMRKQWGEAYPACNLDIQLRQMSIWLQANTAKAKKSNWLKFVTNWLKKEQDRGGDLRGKPAPVRKKETQAAPDPSKIDLPDRFKAWAIEHFTTRRDEIVTWKTWADVPAGMRNQWWGESKPAFLRDVA